MSGSTPRTAANVPFTRTRAASTARAAWTPRSRATRATSLAGSAFWATTITSARSSLRWVAWAATVAAGLAACWGPPTGTGTRAAAVPARATPASSTAP